MWLRKASRQGGMILLVCALTTLLSIPIAQVDGKPTKPNVLLIGTGGRMGPKQDAAKEKAATETLRAFIKDETGMDDEILQQKDWRELADKMSTGKLQVGVYQGEEFAWAKGKYAGLKPLALAVNVYRYPVVYLVTNRTNAAKDFAGLQGQTISVPDTGETVLRLYVDRQCELIGKKSSSFFAKITSPVNVEDAIDDVVDGVTQATVVDRGALEAYKQRKPARFGKLKPIAHSQPLLPAIVAYFDKQLDDATRRRFEKGLLNASRTEKGKTMLALFHLTGFDPVPEDFDTMVERMRKAFPEPKAATK